MRPLFEYLDPNNKKSVRWDGHIHLFNHKETIDNPFIVAKNVTFMDIELDKKVNPVEVYANFIENIYKSKKHILLATATDIKDIKAIYDKHKRIIKGFGELKCYDMYRGEKVPYKKISFVNRVCKFSKDCGNLPVYVHWDINNEKDLKHIENTISTYSSVPIVLCHCGMSSENEDTRMYAYSQVCQLMKRYPNLWVDISYTSARVFANNLMLMDQLDLDRTIIGSDVNYRLYEKFPDTYKEYLTTVEADMGIIERYFGGPERNVRNIKRLFGA